MSHSQHTSRSGLLIEPIGGASGNMLLGAYLDLRPQLQDGLLEFLSQLDLGQWEFQQQRTIKCQIPAQWCDFKIHDGQQGLLGSKAIDGRISPPVMLQALDRLPSQLVPQCSDLLRLLLESQETSGSCLNGLSLAAALDFCLDIFGFVYCWDQLGRPELFVGSIPVGQGYCRYHGQMWPNPSPSVAKLLLGYPQHRLPLQQETVTPTAAAIIKGMGCQTKLGTFSTLAMGYGAGTSDFPISNVVRLCQIQVDQPQSQQVLSLECDIDDMTGEDLAFLHSGCLQAGALDVQLWQTIAKKNRPSFRLTCLVTQDKLPNLTLWLFDSSSSIGLRYWPVQRHILQRTIELVQTEWGDIRRKVVQLPNGKSRCKWENDDLIRLCQSNGCSPEEMRRLLDRKFQA